MSTDLPDVNVLLALHLAEHPAHQAAQEWFDDASSIALTPLSETGLVRLLINPQVVQTVITGAEALAALRNLRSLPTVEFWPDGTSLAEPKVRTTQLAGAKQVTNLHLFNLAVSRSATFVTTDVKFAASLRPAEQRFVRVLGQAR